MQVGDLKYSAHSGDGVGDNEENGAKHKGWGMATSRKTLADIVDLTFGFDPFLRKVIPQTLPRRFAKAFVYTAFVVAFAYLCWYLGYNWFAFFEGICRTKHGTYSIACTQSKDKYQVSGERIHRIAFFGDSLISWSDVDHHMVDTIIGDMESAFPNLSFNGLQSGVGGDTIVRMRTRMYTDLINYHPEAVIILWDSDISDPPESDLLTISALSAYRANLVFVLETLKANGVVYIGVGGKRVFAIIYYQSITIAS